MEAMKDYMLTVGEQARAAARMMARAEAGAKNAALEAIAAALEAAEAELSAANSRDLEAGRRNGLEPALLDRLELTPPRIAAMADGVRQVAALPDPVGAIADLVQRPSGIQVGRMRVPLGVIGIIYESRPNVTADAAALCLKAGNAAVLRGGSEAFHSNTAIAGCIRTGLEEAGLPADGVQLVATTDRAAVGALITMDEYVDVLVPRGGKGLIERISRDATVPVIKHLDGVCHVYIDDRADDDKAIAIAVNAKTHRYGVCNAMETLLLHRGIAERVLPWYFLVTESEIGGPGRTRGAGVIAGGECAAMASWRIDPDGMTLVLDVRCGTAGVELGARTLRVATIVAYESDDSTPFAAARDFAARLSGGVGLMPDHRVYGGNNWYYAYGSSSRTDIVADSRMIAELAPKTNNRPYMVIDDGWQICRGPRFNGGPWIPNDRFGDMATLAAQMRAEGVRPGIWVRPLLTSAADATHLAFANRGLDPDRQWDGVVLDPSRPDTLEWVARDIGRVAEWGHDLIKHDFTTYDVFGQWGFQMGSSPAAGEWTFHDRSRTSAEIVRELYRTIHAATHASTRPEPPLIIGCNAIGHLAVGTVHLQRTGDDTSGREWERTRVQGINTLAFRAHQHGSFFAIDADCVGLTDAVPWDKNEQWLELLSSSGTPLFVSADPRAMGPDQRRAVAGAFARAAEVQPLCEPIDWMTTTCPSRWRFGGATRRFDWFE